MRRALVVTLIAAAFSGVTLATADASSCTRIDVAASPEKVVLLSDLAAKFNASDAASIDGRCVAVHVAKVSSGAGASLLVNDWPSEATNGPKPVIWSPASSAWRTVLEQRRSDAGKPPIAPTDGRPFMLTPLVIAMPKPMARALGWPDTPIGYADILELARDPAGWASRGHPEWGPFRLGKTNPNFSTSALNATIAQYYAATGTTTDLTVEQLDDPQVQRFARDVESAVVHYGDTTLTFLNNLYRADLAGSPFSYASAVAVEEKSVLDYNRGNPDGILDAGEHPKKPRVPLVAVYPKEGTLFSDNPLIILDAPWVSRRQAEGARRFQDFVTRPENQRKVLQFGFRPANPDVHVGAPITRANGLDPAQPQTTLEVPEPAVVAKVIDQWNDVRKRARVLFVIDVSGSMEDIADPGSGASKLELAKGASLTALDQLSPDDAVGLRVFSTDLSPQPPTEYLDLVDVAPLAQNRAALEAQIQQLIARKGTPLYTVVHDSYAKAMAERDPNRINAIVVLSDGRNEDPHNNDLDGLLTFLNSHTEGDTSTPVRIFTVAYGSDADEMTLERIAEATNGAAYDAVDPTTINTVLSAVMSNF